MRVNKPAAPPTSPTGSPASGSVMDLVDLSAVDLPQIFLPMDAAEVLRSLGLAEMTECALRTRAYRKQVPFHLNGRRIVFTLGDLREIVEGDGHRPQRRDRAVTPPAAPPPVIRRRQLSRRGVTPAEPWRARSPRDLQDKPGNGTRT
jgi:hypothetical protein